jgi:hypothetical protein
MKRSILAEKFTGKTVIVKEGGVDGAMRVLNRIMGSEGLFHINRREALKYEAKSHLVSM